MTLGDSEEEEEEEHHSDAFSGLVGLPPSTVTGASARSQVRLESIGVLA